jgi:hypothetical protein
MKTTKTKRQTTGTRGELEVLSLLVDLGDARAADERHGGPLWAEFCDWCWAMDVGRTPESLDLFVADRGGSLSARQLARLRELTGEGQQ